MKQNNNYLVVAFSAMLITMAGCSSRSAESNVMASNEDQSTVNDSKLKNDNDFAAKAADANMLEVKLGQLAQTNANSSEVKNFGNEMITDHSKANTELMDIGSTENISLPTSLTDKSQRMYDDLAKKQGDEFDKAYIKAQVDDHKKVIDAFQKESKNGDNERLKSWAEGKIPILQHHLEMAQNVQTDIQNNNSTM